MKKVYTQKELEVLNDLAIQIFGCSYNELDQRDQDDLYLFGIATAKIKAVSTSDKKVWESIARRRS